MSTNTTDKSREFMELTFGEISETPMAAQIDLPKLISRLAAFRDETYREGVLQMAKEAKHIWREHSNKEGCIHAAPCIEFIDYAASALLPAGPADEEVKG